MQIHPSLFDFGSIKVQCSWEILLKVPLIIFHPVKQGLDNFRIKKKKKSTVQTFISKFIFKQCSLLFKPMLHLPV